jgi:hypothetical protein
VRGVEREEGEGGREGWVDVCEKGRARRESEKGE